MTKTEFIESLQKSLAADLDSTQVKENVAYYQNYIEMEIRKGRSEKEVIEALGNPRLLARTIMGASDRSRGEAFGQECNTGWLKRLSSVRKRAFLILAAILIAVIMIYMMRIFLPILIPVICIVIFIRIINKK